MKITRILSHAKINLALNIIGKKKSLHKIESIISFIELHDVISISKNESNYHQITYYGKFSRNLSKNNTVKKLFQILDNMSLLNGKKFKVKIKKNIPQEAGLGGGSMNAANVLNYLINKKFLKISQKRIQKICNLIGSDVILGRSLSSCILLSNNKIKEFYGCPKYFSLLVKPNFGCSTKKIYSSVRKFSKPQFNQPKKKMFSLKYLINQKNALEEIALRKYPKLKQLKSFLVETNNPIFVRMTGSGSTIIAYYNSFINCKLAKAKISRKYKNYWSIASKTI